jgi:CRP/FNR family transcriptional regulator, cyclic AMP receptor protein
MLGYLSDEMLDKLAGAVDVLSFEEREYIFRQGNMADRFYWLKRGKVLFEQRISPTVTVTVGSVKPGYSFGWSAMLEGKYYTADSVCAEFCEVYSVRGQRLKSMLGSDPAMGYAFSQRLVRVLKSRLDHRTEQFMRVIRNHPELRSLFDNQDR